MNINHNDNTIAFINRCDNNIVILEPNFQSGYVFSRLRIGLFWFDSMAYQSLQVI